jgi:hypothetical protein
VEGESPVSAHGRLTVAPVTHRVKRSGVTKGGSLGFNIVDHRDAHPVLGGGERDMRIVDWLRSYLRAKRWGLWCKMFGIDIGWQADESGNLLEYTSRTAAEAAARSIMPQLPRPRWSWEPRKIPRAESNPPGCRGSR